MKRALGPDKTPRVLRLCAGRGVFFLGVRVHPKASTRCCDPSFALHLLLPLDADVDDSATESSRSKALGIGRRHSSMIRSACGAYETRQRSANAKNHIRKTSTTDNGKDDVIFTELEN